MRHSVILLLGLFLWACATEKSEYGEVVSEWQGKYVQLPDVMVDVLAGDTIDMTDANFTILTYVDSIGCSECKMKLPLWAEFLSSLDGVSEFPVRFLMVVSPSNIERLKYYLKREEFDYPIILDAGSRIEQINSFPQKTILRTFLLDKDRKVTDIGNPVCSTYIAKLYKAIIGGEMSVSAATGDIVSVSDSKLSIRTLRPGEVQSREIVFSNHGCDTVYIEKIISSCECTELSLTEMQILPKSDVAGKLTITGDTIKGDFERTVHVFYSGFEYPTIINLSGNIID